MKLVWIGLAATMLAAPCFAQNPEVKPGTRAAYFRLDFTVKELENGKLVNTRNYSTSASTSDNRNCSIRTGEKIPTQTEKGATYLDIGVNIDCNTLKLVDNQLSLFVTADISGVVPDPATKGAPVIRQNRWSATVLIPLKKAVTIFSSDGATTKTQMQLELTATPIP
ncbi:MAG TPA: hypothetical protein VG273_17040 [Bryobacteraceae bacterium]|nr:hypothetical protein [Bryobacteraceae bacterium]